MKNRPLASYLLLTVLFSGVLWTLIIATGHLSSGFGKYVAALMWCPGLAAMATCKLNRRSLSTLGWGWPRTRYVLLSYFVPVAYAAITYGAVWVFGLGGLNHDVVKILPARFGFPHLPAWAATAMYVSFTGAFGIFGSMSSALGEEIGWRGFLVPELAKRFSFTQVSLISGVIWASWHAPVLLFADYNAGTNRAYALGCFAVMVIADCFVLTWLRLRSGSLWTGCILHAAHNLWIQGIFDVLMRDTGKTLWYTTEFGCGLALTTLVFAIVFWTKRGALAETRQSAAAAS